MQMQTSTIMDYFQTAVIYLFPFIFFYFFLE